MTDTTASFLSQYGTLLGQGTLDTLAMLLLSTALAYVIGLALGVVLYVTAPGGLRPRRMLNAVLGWVVNMARSIPFIILIVSVIPVTKAIAGTTVGVRGVIFPLVLSSAPFVARMVEQSLAEVPHDSIEAAAACGASLPRIVLSALLPEAMPSIVRGVAVTLISVLGYTAIAGAVGAGGLGDIAIRYGYYRYQDQMMVVTIVLLIVLVQLIQSTCNLIAKRIDHR
ncbi:methionine ABC transporter permease [Olsenella profusa]|uniref:ABC transporter, permease protein n=1 Tax=Olsenella profusa F0195 TaxID=1125712 RepID=U2UT79_9ACTN|nr:methionine ABC transporter permease [Olsenella profusa]ERL06302.1 ABC transporter, permease protein [Olsenella profusa F0195]